jgi:hypothetical protein
MVGDMRRPETGDVAIKEVTFNGLTEACGATGGIDFPSRIENERASHGNVRLRAGTLLESDDIAVDWGDMLFDPLRFAIYRPNVLHTAFLSAK